MEATQADACVVVVLAGLVMLVPPLIMMLFFDDDRTLGVHSEAVTCAARAPVHIRFWARS